MILTQQFPTPAAAAEWFNAPANAALRLVSVLPPEYSHPAPAYTALYEERDPVEEARRELLEGRIVALVQLDDGRKRKAHFPEPIFAELLVPLSIVSNRLGQLVTFQEMSLAERARWIRENLAAVNCTLVTAEEAKAQYGCRVELVRLEP